MAMKACSTCCSWQACSSKGSKQQLLQLQQPQPLLPLSLLPQAEGTRSTHPSSSP
jgi:hypothetical protein